MTSFQCHNLQRAITKKKKKIILFFKFSPGYLLIIFYQLTKFEATCCNSFWDVLTTSFQCQNLQRAVTRKNTTIYFNFSSGYRLIIFYQLTKIEATCCHKFWDILITSFQCQTFQRAITKKKIFFFLNFHQIIYSLSTITWLSLKLIAVTVFEMSKFAEGNNSKRNQITFFNFHQVIYSLCSISWPSLKLIAIIVFGYLDYKI